MAKQSRLKRYLAYGAGGFALLLIAAIVFWRGDIIRAMLDPEVPFQTYTPPTAPNYAQKTAWALRDAQAPRSENAAVFFLHSTTFNGGDDWNSPIGDPEADAYLHRVVLPNFAGPFASAGKVSAPLYRQGSLYTRLSIREDAREARAFAYRDVEAAFELWLARNPEGPIVLAGVEQGADLLARILRDRVAKDAPLRKRLVAAYLMDAVVPEGGTGLPTCQKREQTGCVLAWSLIDEGKDGVSSRRMRRALFWDDRGRLTEIGSASIMCVNPVSGRADDEFIEARRHLGAANATGLEWGLRPAFIDRQVSSQCRNGFLRHTRLRTESFKDKRNWADRRKSTPYNLFYADTEADVLERLSVWNSHQATVLQQ